MFRFIAAITGLTLVYKFFSWLSESKREVLYEDARNNRLRLLARRGDVSAFEAECERIG